MLLLNIYEKILSHLGPLTGFVSAARTDRILKGLRMYVCIIQTVYKIGLLSKVTQTCKIILGTAAFKNDSKAQALNRENSPSSSLLISIIIVGFTYMS